MPTRKYSLKKGESVRLELTWTLVWKNIEVRLDHVLLGRFSNKKALEKGKEFSLPDGSILKVQLVKLSGLPTLQTLLNGRPLPGSDSDPELRIGIAARLIYFFGILNFTCGLLAEFFAVGFLKNLGIGTIQILMGMIYLGLAHFVKKSSRKALISVIVIYALDSLLMFSAYPDSQSPSFVGIVVLRVGLLLPLLQALGTLRQVRD